MFGLFPNFAGSFGKVGLTTDVVKTNTYADLGDFSRPMREDEKVLIQHSVEHTYDIFLTHAALVGGYGISSIDEKTGEQEYTPFRHSTSWINVAYGTKWKPSLFVGYTKNLGTDDALASKTTYGSGLNIDKIFIVNACFSYNIAHWQLGLEYCPASAWYGTNDLKDGKVRETHKVTNQRILALMMYYF